MEVIVPQAATFRQSIRVYTDAGFKRLEDGTGLAVGSAIVSFKPGGAYEFRKIIPEAKSSQEAELLIILEALRLIHERSAQGLCGALDQYDVTLFTDNSTCERYLSAGATIPEKYEEFYRPFFEILKEFNSYQVFCFSLSDYKKIKLCDSMCTNLIRKVEKGKIPIA